MEAPPMESYGRPLLWKAMEAPLWKAMEDPPMESHGSPSYGKLWKPLLWKAMEAPPMEAMPSYGKLWNSPPMESYGRPSYGKLCKPLLWKAISYGRLWKALLWKAMEGPPMGYGRPPMESYGSPPMERKLWKAMEAPPMEVLCLCRLWIVGPKVPQKGLKACVESPNLPMFQKAILIRPLPSGTAFCALVLALGYVFIPCEDSIKIVSVCLYAQRKLYTCRSSYLLPGTSQSLDKFIFVTFYPMWY
ncbi:hypothetical protein CEXT_137791 [Caerostris extrusa]|uniref:Uncharacterized protein n=1 Tax=Caerostris extrusa TaxID=172846 RepID=A0AAV4Y5U3_CAEEX|nr:hypothetical protein CEXT_137791 [Caerostris extrusa]